MKISDPDLIKSSEQELLDGIIGDLDWSTIENIFRKKHNLEIEDDVEYKQGDIVVHKNKVAYKLDFEVKVTLSVLFDRNGSTLGIKVADSDDDEEDFAQDEGEMGEVREGKKMEDISKMATDIADMIHEINES